MLLPFLYFATFFTGSLALTITSPSLGQSLDPTQPITITWTSTTSDPSTFDLIIDQPGGLISNKKIATGVSTSSGNYIVASNEAAMTYGDGFVFKAQSVTGDTLATSPSFALSVGSATTIDGQISYVPTTTFTGTISDVTGTAQTALMITTTDSEIVSSSGPTSDMATSEPSMTAGSSSSSTISVTGFSTSTTSRSSSSSTHSASSSSASATTSQNAQPRLGGSSTQIAFSAAGIIAGLAAMLA